MNNHKEEKIPEFELVKQQEQNERALSLQEAVCQNCGTHFDKNKEFCPKCGLKIGSYPPAEVYIRPAEKGAFSRASGILALLSFIFGLFGPLILGIGWLLGIIIGFNVIHTIRRKGGFIRDRKLASWGIIMGFLWIIFASLVFGVISYQRVSRSKLKENEKIAISTLRDIALAERYIKVGYFIDRDNNGQGEYAVLDELFKIQQPYLKAKLDQQTYHGYRFTVHEASETTFLADAIPRTYGRTGASTFYVTHEGFIRGGDIKGESIINTDVILPRLFQDKSVYDDFNEQMTQQLLNLAKRLASENHDFAGAKAIFAEVKSFFPLSKSMEELGRLSAMVENLIQEEKAVQAFQEAKGLKARKEDRAYLSALKSIRDTYPQSKIISEIEEEIEVFNLKFKTQLEEEDARHKKELEKEAAGHIENLFKLSPEKDFGAIATTAVLLKEKYNATEAFKQIKDKLEVLLAAVNFHKLKNEGLDYFRRKDFRQAIITLEEAKDVSAHADPDIINALSESYLREAHVYSREKNWKMSFDSFQNYFKLKSSLPDDMSKKGYARVSIEIAESFFRERNTAEAIKFLDLIRDYPVLPGYAYLKGSIEMANQKYGEAIKSFDRENLEDIEEGKADKVLVKKSLCCAALYLEKEKELLGLLKNEKIFEEKGSKVAMDTAKLLQDMFNAEVNLKLKIKPVDIDRSVAKQQAREEARILAPAEVIAKLNEFRNGSQVISQNILKNNGVMERVMLVVRNMQEYIDNSNLFFSQSESLKTPNYALREYMSHLRQKNYLYKKAAGKLVSGIVYFKDIQQVCMSNIDNAIDDFSEQKSVSKYVERFNSYFRGMAMEKSTKEIEEAEAIFIRSSEIKLPVSECLSSID